MLIFSMEDTSRPINAACFGRNGARLATFAAVADVDRVVGQPKGGYSIIFRREGRLVQLVEIFAARPLGCSAEFGMPQEEAIRVGIIGLDNAGVDQEQLQEPDVAWRSLIATCKGVSFSIIVDRAQVLNERVGAAIVRILPSR